MRLHNLLQFPFPLIAHWENNHFVVIYEANKDSVLVADSAIGKLRYSKEDFCKGWLQSDEQENEEGIALLLEKTDEF